MTKRGYFARDKFDKVYREEWKKVTEHNDKFLKENLKYASVDYLMVKDKDVNDFFKQVVQDIKNMVEPNFNHKN